MKEYNLKLSDGLNASCGRLDHDSPKALIQIINGLKEHKRRYYHLAEFLNNNGYAVFTSDNRGHGYSVNDDFPLGYMTDLDRMVQDQFEISSFIKGQYEKTPLYIIGHSFGSMLARCYLQKHDDMISKMVLSGTVGYNNMVGIGLLIGKVINNIKGKMGYSVIMQAAADNGDISWLCSNEENMEKYRNDHFCTGYKYMNNSIYTIFNAMKELHNIEAYQCKNPELPILSLAGEKDPVTKGEKGIQDSMDTLKKIGYKNISSIVYENMLHEVFNETEKEKVYKDLLDFLDK